MTTLDIELTEWIDGVRRNFLATLNVRHVIPFKHKLLGALFEPAELNIGLGDQMGTMRVRAFIVTTTAAISVQLDPAGNTVPIAANGIFGVVDCELPIGQMPIITNTTATQAELSGVLAVD